MLSRRQLLKKIAAASAGAANLDRQVFALEPDIKPRFRVARQGGRPTFLASDHAILRPGFETYQPSSHYFQQFAEAGVQLFMFNTNAAACDYGHSRPTWRGEGSWDYSEFEERADQILNAKQDAWLLPRVNLGTPRWWLDQHPECLERYADGGTQPKNSSPTLPPRRGFPSFASQLWRQALSNALTRFIKWVESSRFGAHIFGYELAGGHTEEWYHCTCDWREPAGYSRPTQDAFVDWLRRKYRSEQELAEAWGKPMQFAAVNIPSSEERHGNPSKVFREPSSAQRVIDFYQFWNELVAETIDFYAAVVRRSASEGQLVGAFYGYMYEFGGDPEFGHNALAHLARSPNLDFIAVTASYGTRQIGSGGDYVRSPALSVQLHDKVWLHDNDCVSFLARERMQQLGFSDNNPDWTRNLSMQLKSLGYADSAERTCAMYRRGLGFALCQGMFQNWFDLHGGYFDSPRLMEEVKRLGDFAEKFASQDRSSVAQILVVADEFSCNLVTPGNRWLRTCLLEPQDQLIRIGTPCDHVLLEDLPVLNPEPYRLIIFLNCWHVGSDLLRVIADRWCSGGRYLLWCGAAAVFDNNTFDAARMQRLTGFSVELVNESDGPFRLTDRRKVFLPPSWPQGFPDVVQLGRSNWTSLYSPSPALPAAAYRHLAENAGVHLYNDRDDALYACRSLICVHANGDGERVIRLPHQQHACDPFSKRKLDDGLGTLKLALHDGDTVWIQVL